MRIPPAVEGGPDTLDILEGRATGAAPGQFVVLYARNSTWWLQPLVSQPFTQLRGDGSWTNSTHVGTEYAALLVDPGYRPATNLAELPPTGNGVAAVASARGSAPGTVSKMISFSGYEWRLRTVASDRGGRSQYDPANASVDSTGALHLRISRKGDDWSCVEVALNRSFGYGTYSISVRDTSQLEPAAVFSVFTYDYAGGAQNNREMGVETSRWGDTGSQNAQFVLQPFFVPANAARFPAPAGPLTYSMRWETGRLSFRTVQGLHADEKARAVAEHVFTSGVPSPGTETMRMTLYVFRSAALPLQHENEVVVEKFEYLP
jgi:hypothetical protein